MMYPKDTAQPDKRKACKQCGSSFRPFTSTQTVCGPLCAGRLVKAQRKAEIQQTRARKEAIKSRGEWLAEAKVIIQKRRRLEELALGSGCMSCGRSQSEVIGTDGWKPGGAWDGGHFLSKGSRPELALEPLNIWLQCKSCNAGGGKYARKGYTVNASFEKNLIERIGLDSVEWLKGPHEEKHLHADDLKAFIAGEKAKLKELQKP